MATDWQWHWHLLGFWSWVVVPSNPSWVWQCHTCTTDNCNYHPASWHYHYMHEDIFSSLRRSCSSWHHLPSPSPSASQSCQWHPTITIVTIECMRWTMESQQCHHHLHPHLLRYWLPLFFSLTFHLHSCRLTRIMHYSSHSYCLPFSSLFISTGWDSNYSNTTEEGERLFYPDMRPSVLWVVTHPLSHGCQCHTSWHATQWRNQLDYLRHVTHSTSANRRVKGVMNHHCVSLWVIDPSSRGRIRQEQKQQQQ